jgi:hypothetical protein
MSTALCAVEKASLEERVHVMFWRSLCVTAAAKVALAVLLVSSSMGTAATAQDPPSALDSFECFDFVGAFCKLAVAAKVALAMLPHACLMEMDAPRPETYQPTIYFDWL